MLTTYKMNALDFGLSFSIDYDIEREKLKVVSSQMQNYLSLWRHLVFNSVLNLKDQNYKNYETANS